MFLLLAVYFIILFQENYALKDTLYKKNLKFVEVLKQDLRRNNDDYVDMRRRFSETNNTQQPGATININDIRYKIITTRENKIKTKSEQSNNTYSTKVNVKSSSNDGNANNKEDVRIKIIDKIRRRVDNALISKEVISNDTDLQRNGEVTNDVTRRSDKDDFDKYLTSLDNNEPKFRSLWNTLLLQKNNDKVNQYRMKLLSNKTNRLPIMLTLGTTQSTNMTKNQMQVKKSKIENFKKFIRKNKGLLREFISSKRQAANTRQATSVTQQPLTQKQTKMLRRGTLEEKMRQATKRAAKGLIATELPNADSLDMFPAKGGRVHSKRVNGHLCHRHVLMPEGPKYDSKGMIYLAPHGAAGIAHEYNSTDVPKFLLPRCCNCCHKSVLGCE